MRRQRRVRLASGLALLLAAIGVAWGSATGAIPAQQPDWPAGAIHALSQTPTADAQAAAAVLAYEANNHNGHPSLAQLQQLERAARLAPRAPDLASLSMLWCSAMQAHCNVAASAVNLRRLAPGNALGWLPALQTAVQQQHAGAVSDALQHMAAAGHFSLYLGEWVRRIHTALQALPPPGTPAPIKGHDGGRLWQAVFASQRLLPANLTALARACSVGNPAFPSRRSACHAIGGELARSDGYLTVSVGISLLRRTASTADAYRQALLKTLQWKWLLNDAGRNAYQITEACLATADGCAHAWDDLEAFMRAEGHSVTPPADWPTGIRISEFTQHADAKAGVPARFLVSHHYAAYLQQWCKGLPAGVCASGCPCKKPA